MSESPGAAGPRTYFAHESVGSNVLDGVAAASAARATPAPAVRLVTDADSYAPGAVILHGPLGSNGDPLGKIAAFDARVRDGLGERVDVAVMKLCYADLTSETDVEAVADAYVATMTRLAGDFPRLHLVHCTAPVSTRPGVRSRIKKALGRDPHLGPADNVARARYNARIRAEYPADQVFDLAAVESTTRTGQRTTGSHRGQDYERLWRGYAADPGHLNALGGQIAAAALLDVISGVVARTP